MENITAGDILLAVAELLTQRYDVVDLDPAEVDFSRKSALVEIYRVTPQRISGAHYECTAYAQITVSIPQDAYARSSREALLSEQLAVMALFRPGYLRVKSRAPRVSVSSGGYDDETVYIDLQIFYTVPVDASPADHGVITDAITEWRNRNA